MDARYKIAEAMMRGVGQPMAAFPDQRQDDDMALRGMASDLYQADNRRAQDYRAGIKEAILQSWPAELAKVPYNFADFANRVYQGKADPMSDEAIQRSADIAGLMTLGAGAVPAGRNEMRMGIKAYHGGSGDDLAKAAQDKGAWFSEGRDLAKEYSFGGGSISEAVLSPKNPISFRHAEQQRTIGDIISTATQGASGLSDEALSNVRPLVDKLFAKYGDKPRPLFEYWNKDKDIADLFRALGYDAISVAEKSGGPSTWGALNPSIIDIMRKYGVATAAALPAAALAELGMSREEAKRSF
jgi:hypothetical protein